MPRYPGTSAVERVERLRQGRRQEIETVWWILSNFEQTTNYVFVRLKHYGTGQYNPKKPAGR